MRNRQCGRTGLRVSEIGLGTLMWGRDTDPIEAVEMLTHFVDAGGTLVEASSLHGDGMAADVVAEALRAVGRQRVVLIWRGGTRVDNDQWITSGARGDLLRNVDDTLARLGTDYIDAWLAQPDPSIPLTETLGALEDVRRSGKVHYIGLSHAPTWDLAEAVVRMESLSAPLSVVEDEFSLLTAKTATEAIAPVSDRGIGFIGHSPLAAGALTGKYRHSTPPDSRAASSHLHSSVDRFLGRSSVGIIEAVARAADGLDRSPMDVALAWARDFPGVSSVIVGPRTTRQLDQLLENDQSLPAPIREVLNELVGL